MSAGKPDYQKLYDIGKLPKEARGKIPMLAQVDDLEKEIKTIKKQVCKDCRDKIFGEEKAKA